MNLKELFKNKPLMIAVAIVAGVIILPVLFGKKNSTANTTNNAVTLPSDGGYTGSGDTSSSDGNGGYVTGTQQSGSTIPSGPAQGNSAPTRVTIDMNSPTPSNPVAEGSTLIGTTQRYSQVVQAGTPVSATAGNPQIKAVVTKAASTAPMSSGGVAPTGTVIHAAPTTPITVLSAPIPSASSSNDVGYNTEVISTNATNVATIVEGHGQTTQLTQPVAITTGSGRNTTVQDENGVIYSTTTASTKNMPSSIPKSGTGGGYLPVPIPGSTSTQSMNNTQVVKTNGTNSTTIIAGSGQSVATSYNVDTTTAAGYTTYVNTNGSGSTTVTTTVKNGQSVSANGTTGAYNVNVNRAGGQWISNTWTVGMYDNNGTYKAGNVQSAIIYNDAEKARGSNATATYNGGTYQGSGKDAGVQNGDSVFRVNTSDGHYVNNVYDSRGNLVASYKH